VGGDSAAAHLGAAVFIERFGLEGTSEGHLVHPLYHEQVAHSPIQPGMFPGMGH